MWEIEKFPTGMMRFFLPFFEPETGARPPNHLVSPKVIPLANCSTADRLCDQVLKSGGPRLREWFLPEPIPNVHHVDGCCRQYMLEMRFRPSDIPSVPGLAVLHGELDLHDLMGTVIHGLRPADAGIPAWA